MLGIPMFYSIARFDFTIFLNAEVFNVPYCIIVFFAFYPKRSSSGCHPYMRTFFPFVVAVVLTHLQFVVLCDGGHILLAVIKMLLIFCRKGETLFGGRFWCYMYILICGDRIQLFNSPKACEISIMRQILNTWNVFTAKIHC